MELSGKVATDEELEQMLEVCVILLALHLTNLIYSQACHASNGMIQKKFLVVL